MDIKVGEKEAVANEESFEIIKEDWNEYRLTSGIKVRVRTTVLKILRLSDTDGQPLSTKDGDPLIAVKSKIEVITSGNEGTH